MFKYVIKTKTGYTVYGTDSRKDAEDTLQHYEEWDKQDGIFEENFYHIEEDGSGNTIIISNISHKAVIWLNDFLQLEALTGAEGSWQWANEIRNAMQIQEGDKE